MVETPMSKPSLKRSSDSANSSDNVWMEDGDASANKPAKLVRVKIESVKWRWNLTNKIMHSNIDCDGVILDLVLDYFLDFVVSFCLMFLKPIICTMLSCDLFHGYYYASC